MTQQIDVVAMGPHEYGVRVVQGDLATDHRVQVPEQLIDDLGIPYLDEQRLVRESIAFLLEREPATSIMREFTLDDIERFFPDYRAEIGDLLRAG